MTDSTQPPRGSTILTSLSGSLERTKDSGLAFVAGVRLLAEATRSRVRTLASGPAMATRAVHARLAALGSTAQAALSVTRAVPKAVLAPVSTRRGGAQAVDRSRPAQPFLNRHAPKRSSLVEELGESVHHRGRAEAPFFDGTTDPAPTRPVDQAPFVAISGDEPLDVAPPLARARATPARVSDVARTPVSTDVAAPASCSREVEPQYRDAPAPAAPRTVGRVLSLASFQKPRSSAASPTPVPAALHPSPVQRPAPPLPPNPPQIEPGVQPAMAPPPDLSFDGQLDRRMTGPSAVIWVTGAAIALFIGWSAVAPIDEIVRAEGEIVSTSRPQIIQNLEGGILAELHVAEGDVVSFGEPLARLHSTKFQATVDDLEEQIAALEIRRLRLEAELDGDANFTVPPDLSERTPHLVASERVLLAARQSETTSALAGAQAVLDEARTERDLLEALHQEKIVSLIEVTRARKAHSDAEARLSEIATEAELERAAAYSETLKELTSLRQSLRLSQDQLDRTLLASPMKGVVNKLSITTIGGVVRPGEEIMQIIPLGEDLHVDAQVRPSDIANVLPGQAATIKLTAYDYTIYGALSGEVRVISADTFRDERFPDAEPHYKVTVAVDTAALPERQANIEIRPGMQAAVELHTGQKTVLTYLTRPLYKAREAMREP